MKILALFLALFVLFSLSYAQPVCNSNNVCDIGEDCFGCPNDCTSCPASSPQALMCSSRTVDLSGFFSITGIAILLFVIIISLTYMVSQIMSDPKLSLWAKTEVIQLVISAVFIFLVLNIISSFCSFTLTDVASITGMPPLSSSVKIYEGAEQYLKLAANYSRAGAVSARYYLGAINEQEMYYIYECPIWCFFSTQATGVNTAPYAGASYLASGFTVLMQSSLASFFSAMMNIFFLSYVGSGLFLFLLPIAVIVRSLPYMRTFGALLLAVVFAFYIIYPTILAAFYVVLGSQLTSFPISVPNEGNLYQEAAAVFSSSWITGSRDLSSEIMIDSSDIPGIAEFAARGFFYGTFLPALALLTTAAAVMYVGRLMGEEIDLSRLLQMV